MIYVHYYGVHKVGVGGGQGSGDPVHSLVLYIQGGHQTKKHNRKKNIGGGGQPIIEDDPEHP